MHIRNCVFSYELLNELSEINVTYRHRYMSKLASCLINTVDSLIFDGCEFSWISWVQANHKSKCSPKTNFLKESMQSLQIQRN